MYLLIYISSSPRLLCSFMFGFGYLFTLPYVQTWLPIPQTRSLHAKDKQINPGENTDGSVRVPKSQRSPKAKAAPKTKGAPKAKAKCKAKSSLKASAKKKSAPKPKGSRENKTEKKADVGPGLYMEAKDKFFSKLLS